MSTTTYAADDTTTIGARLKELAAEREEARKQCDPKHANGDNLDRVAADWGEKRTMGGLLCIGLVAVWCGLRDIRGRR